MFALCWLLSSLSPHLFILFHFFRVILSLSLTLTRFYFMPLSFNLLFIMLPRSYYSFVVFHRHKRHGECVYVSEMREKVKGSKTRSNEERLDSFQVAFLLPLCNSFFFNVTLFLCANWLTDDDVCLLRVEMNKKKQIMLVGKMSIEHFSSSNWDSLERSCWSLKG